MTEQDIEREVERYMGLPYRVELTPDGDGWFVRVPDLTLLYEPRRYDRGSDGDDSRRPTRLAGG